MRKEVVKAVSAATAFAVLMSVASCSKKTTDQTTNGDISHSGTKIAEDSPWYSGDLLRMKPSLDEGRQIDSTYSQLAGADEKYIVILTSGYYKIPDDLNWNDFNNNDYVIYTLTVLDRSTKQTVNTIDLVNGLAEATYVDDAEYRDGKIEVRYAGYDSDNDVVNNETAVIDAATGSIIETKPVVEGAIDGSYKVGSYRVDISFVWDEPAFVKLTICSSDGQQRVVQIKDPVKNVYDIPVIIPLSETTALVPASGDGSKFYYELNLQTGMLTPVDEKEYEWIDLNHMYGCYSSDDGSVYFSTGTGIDLIDMKNKSAETVFDYSWCGINRNDFDGLEIADVSADSLLLCGESYAPHNYSNSGDDAFLIIELTKAPNPHAGKTILEMYIPAGSIDTKIADAILKYNETSSDYYIEVTDRYNEDDYFDFSQHIDSDDDYESFTLNGNGKLSNALAMDILNGEGPDILMCCSAYGQLNDSDYLADLTPYVGTLDPEKYFTNIFEGAKTDGKLYQLPVSYSVSGIQTDPKYAGASGIGFTTEEYERFLNEVLNGTDVIPSGQAFYFAKLFDSMSDKFIVDGKADFTGPEFKELAEFVKNNVPESSRSWSQGYENYEDIAYAPATEAAALKGDRYPDDPMTAGYTDLYGMSGYIMGIADGNNSTAVLGIPSADGRGPMFDPVISVAVSSQAVSIDACGKFVQMLLSDDIQQSLAMGDNFVLSREAFRQAGSRAVEYYNGEGAVNIFGYDPNTGEPMNHGIIFSDQTVTDMENIILSCSRMKSGDANITLILIEEMPAYFMDQKNLEDVVAIAQDRVQKVLDERG